MRPALTLTVVALCLVLAAPSAPAVAAAAAPTPTSAADRAAARAIDAYTQPLVARGDLSGQLLVLRDGRVVAERSYGYANAELRAPVTPETRFNIASVTKPMTAVIAIHLIEAGMLGVSDTIARWLPDFPKADSIRVEHLLRHRSGIPHETIPDSERTHPFTSAEVVARAARLPLDFSPGSRGNYSSGGYEVLARVLELASGRTYQQLLEQHLFGPLGMTHTTDADSRRLMPGRAQGYVPGVHGLQNAPLEDFSALIGAGSVWSTARDLHRFVVAVVAGKLGAGPQQSFVRGGHLDFNGRTGGFKAWALWDSTSGVEAIFLGNLAGGASDALKRDILRLASGQFVPTPTLPALRDAPLTAEEMQHWIGIYRIPDGPRLPLRVHDGALYSNDWLLLPTRDGALFSPRDYGIIRGVTGADGKLERIDWTQGSETYAAPRVGE